MSIAVGASGGFWEIRHNDEDPIPTHETAGFEGMPDKSSALNVDAGTVRFYNRESGTWSDPH